MTDGEKEKRKKKERDKPARNSEKFSAPEINCNPGQNTEDKNHKAAGMKDKVRIVAGRAVNIFSGKYPAFAEITIEEFRA